MKTTRTFRAMLSLITVGLLVGSVMGQTTNTDNYAESFEDYAVGTSVSNFSGSTWTSTETNSAIVSTNYTDNYKGGDYPIDYDHAVNPNTLQFDNGVTNTIAVGTLSITNWVDCVMKPVIWSDDTPPEFPQQGAVAALYFSSNRYPVVMHTVSNDLTSAKWIEIPLVTPIGSNDWIRLTVTIDLASPFMDSGMVFNNTRFYKVSINGTELTSTNAFQGPGRGTGTDGPWFGNSASAFTKTSFSDVIFRGNGFIDDLVVTNALSVASKAETFIESVAAVSNVLTYGQMVVEAGLYGGTATNAAGANVDGAFTFTDPSAVPSAGTNSSSVTFTPDDTGTYMGAIGSVDVVVVAAATYIDSLPTLSELMEGETLGDVVLSGGSVTSLYTSGAIDGSFAFVMDATNVPPVGTNSYDVAFTPVTGNYLSVTDTVSVVVAAAPTVTTKGTPISWYDGLGMTPGDEGLTTWDELDAFDSDGDGMANWLEYIAGTNPQDGESVFKLVGLDVTTTNLTLQWIGGTNGPTAPYVVESADTLGGSPIGWANMSNVLNRVEGTNAWTHDGLPTMRFYRVRATGD